jgi:hypothetical protein
MRSAVLKLSHVDRCQADTAKVIYVDICAMPAPRNPVLYNAAIASILYKSPGSFPKKSEDAKIIF